MGLLDALIYGVRDIFDIDNVRLPRRSRMRFLCTVEDNSINDEIVVHAGEGPTTDPGGEDTQAQYNDDGVFGGMTSITYDKDTEVATITEPAIVSPTFTGVSVHNDDYANFVLQGDGYGACVNLATCCRLRRLPHLGYRTLDVRQRVNAWRKACSRCIAQARERHPVCRGRC